MILKCQKCEVHFDEKDLYEGMCRECIIEEDHDCKREMCEVCAFVNYDREYEESEKEYEETERGSHLHEI